MKKTYRSIQILGYSLFGGRMSELLSMIEQHLHNSRKLSYIFTPNPEQVIQAENDPDFRLVLQTADVLVPDGVGLVWASELTAIVSGQPSLDQRLGGVDLVDQLIKKLLNVKYMLIGGRDLNQSQLEKMGVVWHSGYQDATHPRSGEEEALTTAIKQHRPEVVFVAFGAPYQEKWAVKHRQLLEKAGVKLVIAVGGSFDYLLGGARRAPVWMRKLGLEWAFRLVTQPWRWRRQLRLPQFAWLVGKDLLLSALTHT